MLRVAFLAVVTAALVLVACSAPLAASPGATDVLPVESERTAAESDGPPRTSKPDCYSAYPTRHTLPPTIENLLPFTDNVAIVRVVAEGKALWNTEDGKAPPPDKPAGPDFDPAIFTPYEVDVLDVVAGQMSKEPTTIYLLGGVVDCIEFIPNPRPVLKPDATYAVVMQPARKSDFSRDPKWPSVLEAWPADDEGKVTTPLDGVLDKADFAERVQGVREPIGE